MLDEKVANLIPIHESSETKYLQFGLQQYATVASQHILYVENYVAKCLSVWLFSNNMLQILTKLEPVKLNSECKPVGANRLGIEAGEEKGLGFGFGKWDPRDGREREGFTLKKEEVD